MHSSYMTNNNNNIIISSSSSDAAATLYPFPPYNFPFSSSSSSSISPYNINNTHHHPFLPQENTTTGGAGFFGLLNSDQFSLLNRPCFPAPRLPESSVGGFYGSSSYHINDNHNNISHHHPAYFVSSNYNKDDQPAKVPVKKVDRHSKIFTSQGLRDRRVRLSINIAREFFDLQDLLGFDKASKTLEWLLTKSRDAIRDLQEAAGNSSTSLSSSSTYSDDDCDGDVSKKQEARQKRRKMKEAAAVEARATRAKARARARERTREKGQSGKISGCSQQLKSLSNLNSLADDHELNPEIIRTWTTSTSSNWCSSQINIQFPNAAAAASHQNWNINDGGVVFTCPSNSCAINTTMNPNSTGV